MRGLEVALLPDLKVAIVVPLGHAFIGERKSDSAETIRPDLYSRSRIGVNSGGGALGVKHLIL